MPPKKRPPTLEEAQTNGSRFMKDFFPTIKKTKLKQMDASKLTKKELAAVLLVVYGADFLKEMTKEKKTFFVKKLTDEYSANPVVIDAYCIAPPHSLLV
jgi:hypothetical protein